MAEGVNVRLTGPLREYIEQQSGPEGLYESASEYIRDLVRRDFERVENKRWAWLVDQLKPGIAAQADDFIDFNPAKLIAQARSEK